MEPRTHRASLINRENLARLEPGAVDAFVRSTVDRIHSLLYGIIGHAEEVEDLAQEVYMRAFKALPAYRGEAAPETWLHRIAINVGRDAISRRQAERKREGGEVDPELHAAPDNPAADLEAVEDERILRAALKTLPDEWRELVVFVEIEGGSIEEAAGVFEIAAGTVKSRLHRAREKLREEVKRLMKGGRT
jgi:RNA polymerase sigma-70 factor (ECF subfamily)